VTRTCRLAAVASLAAVLLSAGCGGDDPHQTSSGPSTPTSEATSATSASTDGTEGTGGTSTSSPPTPSITPASGVQLTEASSTIRAPAGWKRTDDLVSYASGASDRTFRNSVDLVDSGDLSGGGPLDQQAQIALHNLPEGATGQRLPDVQLDGVTAFHIHYTVPGDRSEYDSFTTVRNGRNVGLDFVLEKKNAATNPDLVASVLATFQWIA
jgi:hypothetical protein